MQLHIAIYLTISFISAQGGLTLGKYEILLRRTHQAAEGQPVVRPAAAVDDDGIEPAAQIGDQALRGFRSIVTLAPFVRQAADCKQVAE